MRRTAKLIPTCLILAFLLTILPAGASAATIIDSGYCGGEGYDTNVAWTLDSDGVLTISGSGAMADVLGKYGDDVRTVILQYGVTSIGRMMFDRYDVMTSVIIPNSVTTIGNAAFQECRSLTEVTIPDSVTTIGDFAFNICESLTNVTISNNVTTIGEGTFQSCGSLTSVTIPNNVTTIGKWAFNHCFSLMSVTIPDSVISIGESAFSDCRSLTSVSIPNSVTTIGEWAFSHCRSLTSVTIPNSVTTIGEGTFDVCDSLTSVTIPDSVTTIGDYAFYACHSLTSVTIPVSVTTIGEGTFDVCDSLTSVTIPDSVTTIGKGAFSWCLALTDVYYGGTEADWAAIAIGTDNEPLRNATIHYGSGISGEAEPPEEEDASALPVATQYVPYSAAIPAGSGVSLASGRLPDGLSLGADGVVSGIPTELGVFPFTVTGSGGEREYTLSVYSRMYADVEENNVPGYGFVETAGDDGRVRDQTVTSAAELTDQVMHLEGAYPEFRDLYLDARKLVRGVEYEAASGSTKLTVYAETIGDEGGGTHTLAAEFETAGGEKVYTVQNYRVAGIASREVHVTVRGETVIWTDAEPYIDTNSRTMTPFRVVGDALGLEIGWDGTAKEASFSDGAKTIYFPIGSTTARTSEGRTVEMDTSAVIVNGRTYAPVRYLAEFFGYTVAWDRSTRTVVIG